MVGTFKPFVKNKDEKMLQRTLSFCMAVLILVGCNKNRQQQEYFPYTDAGVLKPRIAIASVTDSSGKQLPWDVSDEIVHGMRHVLHNEGNVYVLPQAEVYSSMALLGNFDLFGANLFPWKSFCHADYVVLIDLFDRQELPFGKGKFYPIFPTSGNHSGTVLAMKLRFKVIDVRAEKPKLVLFEVMESNHLLPFGYEGIDPKEIPWGHKEYCNSPMGMVNNRLIYQLTDRINTVICDAR